MQFGQIVDLFTNRPEWLNWILAHSDWIWPIIGMSLLFILVKIAGQQTKTIYQQSKKEGFADFKDYGSRTFYKSGPMGASGEGRHRVLQGGIVEISRTNTEGRWILQFLSFRSDDDQTLPYIPARREAGSQRSFNVSLEAKAIRRPHTLRVAFRSYPDEEFIQDAYMAVDPDKWQKFERLMVPPADKDMYFFLESTKQTEVSSVHVRKLVLREALQGQRFGWLIQLLKRSLHRKPNGSE
jgi:hypothetical protein